MVRIVISAGAVVVTAATLGLVTGGGSADAGKKPSAKCTVRGTDGADELRGKRGRDVICARGGDDRVFALRGDDLVRGGPGDDELHGDSGDDQLVGGPGNDALDGGEGLNSCAGGAPTPGPNLCVDYLTIERFSLSRQRVNTEHASKEIEVEIEISNTEPDASAIRDVELNPGHESKPLDGGSGILRLEQGDAMRGTWRGHLFVPQQTPRGTYEVGLYIFETDPQSRPGRTRPINGSRIRRAGFDNTFEQMGRGDNGAPEIRSFEFTPATIDTSQGPATVTSRIRIVDDTGLTGGVFLVRGPSGTLLGNVYSPGRLVSGDERDGIWENEIRLIRHAAQGEYRIDHVSLGDRFTLQEYTGAELRRQGVAPSFEQVGPGDNTPPVLQGLTVEPDRVDATGGSEFSLDVHVQAGDDLTGIEEWSLEIRRPQDAYPAGGTGGSYYGFGVYDSPKQIDETLAGRFPWTGEPAPAGDYLFTVQLRDAAGNYRAYPSSELAGLGFSSVLHNGP